MTRRVAFALGLGLGALVTPAAHYLGLHYAGRHWLDVQRKDQR